MEDKIYGNRIFKKKNELQEELSWDSISGTRAHLREERPLILGLLDAVGHQPFHGFGAVLVELAEVGGQVAPPHHVDDLKRRRRAWMKVQIVPSERSPTSGTTASLLRSNTRTGPRSGLRVGGRTEPKHRRTPAYQHTPILTHKQDCVTASKIRPVAPGSLSLFHGGSGLHEPLHPFGVVRTLFLLRTAAR